MNLNDVEKTFYNDSHLVQYSIEGKQFGEKDGAVPILANLFLDENNKISKIESNLKPEVLAAVLAKYGQDGAPFVKEIAKHLNLPTLNEQEVKNHIDTNEKEYDLKKEYEKMEFSECQTGPAGAFNDNRFLSF